MKIILATVLIIFGAFMAYVFVGGFIQQQSKVDQSTNTNTNTNVTTTQPSTVSQTSYTIAEIAKHNTSSDCWLLIDGNVYNVGKFLGSHPGGTSTILPYCGKEATNAFDTLGSGSGRGHSNQATNMLAEYLIGKLQVN